MRSVNHRGNRLRWHPRCSSAIESLAADAEQVGGVDVSGSGGMMGLESYVKRVEKIERS